MKKEKKRKEKLWFILFCCFRTVRHLHTKIVCRITELQFRKVLCLTLEYYWRLIFIVRILFLLFSQGSCLCILSYAAEHPNLLMHQHTQNHEIKTPHEFKKFWTDVLSPHQQETTLSRTLHEKRPGLSTSHTTDVSHLVGLLLCYAT